MTYMRRFDGFTPPERDSVRWVQWRIEEALTPTDVDAVTIEGPSNLSPAITDTEDPPTYSFETTNATLTQAWYRVVWIDENGGDDPTQWIPLRTLSQYAPTVADVAVILRARIVANGGTPLDSFTDQTNPTAQDVQQAIIMFAPLVLAMLGRLDNLGCSNSEDLRAAATAIAAQRVALEIEASYWPEEITESASVESRRLMLDADMTGLIAALDTCRASDDDGGNAGESDARSDPAWTFSAYRPLRY